MMTKTVNRIRQERGDAMGNRRRSTIGGGKRGLATIGYPSRAFRYADVGLAVVVLGAILTLGAPGCQTTKAGNSQMISFRSQAGEISRLTRNAHYYQLMGRPELALKELEQAHQKNPDNLAVLNLLARNYEEVGMFEDARKLYEKALTQHGSHPVLANNLCFSYYQEGRWQEAENCFRRALAQNPKNAAARNNLGLLYCRLGRPDEARRLWQETEGVAAAEAKMGQALASLGIKDPQVYAQGSKPVPSSGAKPVKATVASAPPAPPPAKVRVPAAPVKPKKAARHLAAQPPKAASAPSCPQPEAEIAKPAAVVAKAQPQSPAPSAHAAPLPRPAPLSAAELLGTAVEVRNGTPTPDLARRTRTLLNQEGFTVSAMGNHLDFGARRTVIYHRPKAEKVAQSLRANFFPTAALEQTAALNRDADIKVLLGHDLLTQPEVMARLNGKKETKSLQAASPVRTNNPAAATPPAPAAPGNPPSPSATPDTATLSQKPGERDSSTPVAQTPPALAPAPLTTAELLENAIEVRNGAGAPHLAQKTRSLLNQEGFTVSGMGNHIDFGARQTIIYFRPPAKKVAVVLKHKFFRGARLEPAPELNGKAAVKILLGADLLKRPQLMARLAEEGVE